jgi:methionyl-tRNA formyltransferase
MQLDVLLVVAFGHILRPALLQTARCGAVNVHASLLPRWRGASPVEQAILAGDRQTGVTLMQLDAGVDTGPMIASRAVAIDDTDTRLSLLEKLAVAGAQVLEAALLPFLAGTLPARAQPAAGVLHAPRLEKQQGLLDWQHTAIALERQVRAFHGWPGCYTLLQGDTVKVHAARAHVVQTGPQEAVGSILAAASVIASGIAAAADAVVVACGENVLELLEVQLPGKRLVAAAELRRSGRLQPGMHFDSHETGTK